MEYEVERKPFWRGLRLSVQRDGRVRVLAPMTAPVALIDRFVCENRSWISRQLGKWKEFHRKNPEKRLENGERLLFLGRERELVLEFGSMGRRSVDVIEDYLIVALPAEMSLLAVREALRRYYDRQARLHLPERIQNFSKKMNVVPSGLSFRAQKTRWGSCSPSGHISLNYKMMIAPEAVIDYVIVHELAHLVHANHSGRFWNLVETFDPQFKENRRWLREHQFQADFLDRKP